MDKLPEAYGSEDGDSWFVLGHVDPAIMVLSVIAEQAGLCGEHEVFDFVKGWDPKEPDTWNKSRTHLASLVKSVKYRWMKPHPTDEEQSLPAQPWEAGAEEWTELRV